MRNLKGLGIVLFAVAGVIPVAVLFLLIQALGKSGGKQEAEQAQARLAGSVSAQVESLIAASLHEAKSLKTNPSLVDVKADPKVVEEELRRLGKVKFDDLSLINADGAAAASTNPSIRGDASEGLKLAQSSGQAVISYPLTDGGAQKSSYSIYQPMKTPDQRVIRLDFSFDRVHDILSKVQLGSGEKLFLIDATNRVLFAKDPAMVLAAPYTGVSGFTNWDGADDGESIETSNKGAGYVQTVVLPELMDDKKKWLLVWEGGNRGGASLGMLPILFVAAAAVGIGLAFLLSTLLTGKVRGAIIDVTEGLEAVSSGDMKVALDSATLAETGAMVEAFNEMVENIRAGRDTLETKLQDESGALRVSKERLSSATSELRAAFEAAREAVVMLNFDGKVIEANQHFCDLASLPMKDLKAFAPDAIVEQLKGRFKDSDGFGRQWQHLADNPRAVGNEEWLTPGSNPLTIDIRTVPVMSDDDEVMGRVWVFRDVTEVRSLDLQLRQSQKMGALGNLTAGVAHDFNNMLQGISGNVAFASLKLAEGENESVPEHLGVASEACEKSASLVRQLLNFSRKEDFEELVVSCDVKKVVQETAMLLSRTLDPRLKLEVQVDEGVWPAKGDGNQLQQVLMNMCVNAGDAIYEEGTIRLEVANRVKVKVGGGKGSRSGEFVEVAIVDDGEGMVEEIRERIFEPFFSTKAQGDGTGLGLATCASILEKLGGWIECESELALGTTFRIFLPRSRKAAGGGTVLDDVNMNFDDLGDGFRGGEGAGLKALVVDDEESVRDVAANILQEEGYEVLMAGNGEEAMKIIHEQEGNLAIVVLDLTMPVMSGRDAFIQMRDEFPDLPVIICSGYLMDIIDFVSELGHEPNDKVQKPYRLNVLREKIKQVIAATQPAGGASAADTVTDSPS